jgi:hypothetical protein
MPRATLLLACLGLACKPGASTPQAAPADAHTGPPQAAAAPATGPHGRTHDVSGSYDGGAGCTPRGDTVELTGELVVEPFGKGTDGARLLTADGERWILAYRAQGPLREHAGKRVAVRGRACDKQGEAIAGRHFDAVTLSVE